MHKRFNYGFTLVELLIVIVVIAILAAITIVAYNGIQERAQTSSLQNDMQAMDSAQKRYMALTGGVPLSYNSQGEPNDILAFVSNEGNSIVVRLVADDQYCIYGYNPGSQYPSPDEALIRPSSDTPCDPLVEEEVLDPDSTLSTVSVIGQRIEAFYQQHGHYPQVDDLIKIGLVIKPNSGNANQKQLYCRNNSDAIYLQVDKSTDVIYVYVTASHSVVQPIIEDKLSLNIVCQQYTIDETDPGYESTGVKNPDF